jgi:2-oxoisovalerate dehydrogenase E1 component
LTLKFALLSGIYPEERSERLVALQLYNPGTDASVANPQHARNSAAEGWRPPLPKLAAPPAGDAQKDGELVRWPHRMGRESLYRIAYPLMCLSRRLEDRLLELYQKGYVKGTVTSSAGNEAAALGMALPLRPGRDVLSLLHRDFCSHLLMGATPYQLVCQYLANADSPTHACEGNVHHGDAAQRRFPMISHLGKMLSVVVGGTWAARRNGERVFGLAVIGDGGTSTGEFHESLNMASVHKVPVLFLIENNHYAFSTPTSVQYNCRQLSERAAGYGIAGRTIDGTDPWTVYSTVCEAIDGMEESSLPVLLECDTRRLCGHAVYDKALYVPSELMEQWRKDDPLAITRHRLAEVCGLDESSIAGIEAAVDAEVRDAITRGLAVARPKPPLQWPVHAEAADLAEETLLAEEDGVFVNRESAAASIVQAVTGTAPAIGPVALHRPAPRLKPLHAKGVKNGDAVNMALDYLLANEPGAFLAGMDVGTYGSAFKTCKGLVERYGANRVIDMPLAESAIMGFALGASQTGAEPIIEFQFADFSTEAVTQLGLNAGTWYFRTGCAAPMLVRLPCGGGLTMGAFHSGEFEGLWSRFPGLKLLYPATAQETYETLLAGFYDPNPCLVFENKLLYWSRSGDIDFDGDLKSVWRPRRYAEGSDLTLVALGAMVHPALAAAAQAGGGVDVWNPLVLQPLDIGPIAESLERTGRLLVVQESGETQGLADRLVSLLTRECFHALKEPPEIISSPDTPVPFAPELEAAFRPSQERICKAISAFLAAARLRKVA